MLIYVCDSPIALAEQAARQAADTLRAVISRKGSARIMLSTGASQLDTINSLIASDIDWSKVEMFHLDEYINLPESHPASFRKYLKERFVAKVKLKQAHFVLGEGNIAENIRNLSSIISEAPIDLGLIGIGENTHIAFNDPPANFDIEDPYIVVNLDDDCKKQQVREGWFKDLPAVPPQAITASVKQIMRCDKIISCVPFSAKAPAIKKLLESDATCLVPATILKTHSDVTLYLDRDSASLADKDKLEAFAK